jgi:triphosphoribosyl-dephospho-CoA synthase
MLSEQEISAAVKWACHTEVKAPKPGNVNCFSDGHNMLVDDFLRSAEAIAPVMAQADISVGERILNAVKATRQHVDCNTNLGIILLFAPLCQAAQTAKSFTELRNNLSETLVNLTIEDAIAAYEAIRGAEAGGLGRTAEQDVSELPTVTLFEAMKMAADRDTIAKQYTTDYALIFDTSLPALKTALDRGESVEWASAFAYLCTLTRAPDSLVSRKYSAEHAQAVTTKAQQFVFKSNENKPLSAYKAQLHAWDTELKQKAINPGTSADLTAASLLLLAFEHTLSTPEFQYHDAFGPRH